MAKPTGDEILKQGHKRIFRQPGGPGIDNAIGYAGVSDQYLAIQGASRAINGGTDPINVPDPLRRLAFKKVGKTISAPGNNTFDLKVLTKHGTIPFTHSDLQCDQNLYVSVGECRQPSDFTRGWSDYVRVFAYATPDGDLDEGDLTGWGSDDMDEQTLPFVDQVRFSVGAINFGEKAGPQVDREVVGVVYGSSADCGVCGPRDDGTKRIYWVTKSSGGGSPGLPGEVIYTTDGGTTFAEATITGLGATADPSGIEILSGKLVIIVNSEDAYYYADLNADTGVPGTFTKVTGGFVAAGSPNDIYTPDGVTGYICGDAGYVYKLSSVGSAVEVLTAGTVTTNNLTRIDGDDATTIVAVGGNATIVKSRNSGATWAATASAPLVGTNILQAVAVVDDVRYFVGSAQGYVYGTVNGGASWASVSFSGSGAGAVYDILDVGGGVLYISHSDATPTARIFSTWAGGAPNTWTNEAPRINNLATFNRANRLAAPRVSVQAHTIAANYLAIAGLAGNGVDGFLGLGSANIV